MVEEAVFDVDMLAVRAVELTVCHLDASRVVRAKHGGHRPAEAKLLSECARSAKESRLHQLQVWFLLLAELGKPLSFRKMLAQYQQHSEARWSIR